MRYILSGRRDFEKLPNRSAFTTLAISVLIASASLFAMMSAPAQAAEGAKTDAYYADPGAPRMAGQWIEQGGPGLGVWIVDGKPLVSQDEYRFWQGMPYTPPYMKAYDSRRQAAVDGRPLGDPHMICWPRGVMNQYYGGPPAIVSITQTPGRVQMVFNEDSEVRDIYTDGRPIPERADPKSAAYSPRTSGYSIGRWENNSLLVETRGVRRELSLGFMAPHSDVTVFRERMTLTPDNALDVEVTIEDQKALARPLRMKLRFRRDDQEHPESFCAENNHNVVDSDGHITTVLGARPAEGWDLPQD